MDEKTGSLAHTLFIQHLSRDVRGLSVMVIAFENRTKLQCVGLIKVKFLLFLLSLLSSLGIIKNTTYQCQQMIFIFHEIC